MGMDSHDGQTGTANALLTEDEAATLHQLAAEYGVSAERIRQIEARALKKMREMIPA